MEYNFEFVLIYYHFQYYVSRNEINNFVLAKTMLYACLLQLLRKFRKITGLPKTFLNVFDVFMCFSIQNVHHGNRK